MNDVPAEPAAFFSSYLPARFAGVRGLVEGVTSVGSVVFRVPGIGNAGGDGEWSLRLVGGELEVARGLDDDVLLQVTVPAGDFRVLVADAVERAREHAERPSAGLAPLRALAVKPETARLVRHVPGSVLFAIRDGDVVRRLLVTPGRRHADLDAPECTIECRLSDLVEAGERGLGPMQLFAAGKLRISGNVQIAMAIAGVFA